MDLVTEIKKLIKRQAKFQKLQEMETAKHFFELGLKA